MGAGKHWTKTWQTGCVFKGAQLSADERQEALRLKRQRFPDLAIARALGRALPTITEFLKSPEAQDA
jgi:IS30 family transposase